MNHKTLTIKGMLAISGIVVVVAAAVGLLAMWSTSQIALADGTASSAGTGPSGSAGGEIVLCKSEALVMIAIGGGCSGSNPE
jgi:hypothetical protein